MMKKVVILDDGVSYFTNPTHLHKVYGRFWDAGVPISIAMTPAIRGDVKSENDSTQYFGGIHKDKQGQHQPFKLSDNTKLCDYLNVMADQRLVEICVRGYNGTIDEFDSDDDVLLQQKIEVGLSVITQSLPDAAITTFVLPQHSYSPTAVELLSEYDFNICLPAKDKSAFQMKDITDSRKSFTYPLMEELDPGTPGAQIDSHDFFILRHHYWMVYDDNQVNESRYANWQSLVDNLLKRDDIEIETFSFI